MAENTFFDMARAGKRVTPAWWAIPYAIVAMLVGNIIGGILFFVLMMSGVLPNSGAFDPETLQMDMAAFGSVELGLFLILPFGCGAILILLWIWLYEKRSLASFGLGNIGAGLMKFARGGVLALIAMALIAFGLQALGMAEVTERSVPQSWTMVWPLLVLILGWCVQGSTEEFVARGLLFQSVGARHGMIVALVISSGVFAIAHGMNSNPSALFFVNLALYSLFVCFYALREASLWGVCGYHAIWNFAQGNLFGFAVSGESLGSDRWMSFVETGPDLITGGATGPEGGLVTIVALALSTVAVLAIKPDQHAKDIADAARSKAAPQPAAAAEG